MAQSTPEATMPITWRLAQRSIFELNEALLSNANTMPPLIKVRRTINPVHRASFPLRNNLPKNDTGSK
jgi:hypothetical protein